MATFAYKARSGSGKTEEGLVEAESRLVAVEKLSRMGYFPVRLEERPPDGGAAAGARGLRRVSARDLGLWTRQASDLLESGVPLLKALQVVQRQTANRRLSSVARDLAAAVEGGKSLSEAMGLFPSVFPSLYPSLARAGESAGALGPVLGRLADFAENEEEFRSKLRAALVYPLFVLVLGAGTVLFLMAFVVPRLAGMFADLGQPLPLMTRLLTRTSGFLAEFWWAGLPAVLGAAVAFGKAGREGAIRRWADSLASRAPLWGSVARKAAVARFARTLSLLLAGGVPILEALRTSAEVLGSPALKEQALSAAALVRDGAGLAEALERSADFPPFLCQMIAVGEEGNILEKSLQKAAATYEREADRAMKIAAALLEPVMILGVGGAVALIVVALLLPIFQIPTLIK